MSAPIPLAVVTFLVALSSAALVSSLPNEADAQSASASPGASQYSADGAAASAAAVPPAVTDNVAGGTGPVNDAMTGGGGDGPSPAAASPSASPEENMKALPETGGAPLGYLLLGVCLLGCGLLVRVRPPDG
jgi:hypothetical protein